jgi:hypothetical protein
MGANFAVYDTGTDSWEEAQDLFREYQQQECHNYGDDTYAGHLGIKDGLVLVSKTFASYAEAEEYLMDSNGKWEAAEAVPYRTKVRAYKYKRDRELKGKIQQLAEDLDNFESMMVAEIKNAKSKTIGCKRCGSSVARAYIKHADCPVCGKHDSLLSDTRKQRRIRMKHKLSEMRKRLKNAPTHLVDGVNYLIGGWCAS